MTAQRVAFRNVRGQTLVGLLHGEPDGAVAMSCHGMLSTKDGEKHAMLAELLAERGIAMLRFDFAGRGESDGELFDLSYSNEMEDLDAAVSFVAERGIQRVGVFGSSMGGAVALMAAARDERIVAVATLAAVGYPEAIAERYMREAAVWRDQGFIVTDAGRIGCGFLDDAEQHNLIASVRVLRAPILVLHGEDDDIVPCSDGHDIASAARNAELEIVLGADHRFSNPVHLRPAMRKIADFLASHLKA
ncbi:MAG: alpha/beta fold hydrolase [Myxococcota bacterium]